MKGTHEKPQDKQLVRADLNERGKVRVALHQINLKVIQVGVLNCVDFVHILSLRLRRVSPPKAGRVEEQNRADAYQRAELFTLRPFKRVLSIAIPEALL